MRIISRGTGHPWSPQSPDLNPLDFHLSGYLMKIKLCGDTFENTHHIKTAISRGITEIPKEQGHVVSDTPHWRRSDQRCWLYCGSEFWVRAGFRRDPLWDYEQGPGSCVREPDARGSDPEDQRTALSGLEWDRGENGRRNRRGNG